MIFRFRSPAKLNLFLRIKDKTKDGYHNLQTIFERIDLCDDIHISLNNSNKVIVLSDKIISPQKANLAYIAADLIKKKFNIKKGILIKIKKRIPIGSGLGGASSNTATVLIGLNQIFGLKLSKKSLMRLTGLIGSDAPFFVLDKSFAYGTARGQRLKPILTHKNIKLWHILIVPKIRNLTKDMYRRFDDYLRLTKSASDGKIKCFKNKQISLKNIKNNLFNSFEAIAGPEIKKIKDKLTQLNVKYILMSGSGSAVFGIVNTRKEAINLVRRLKRERLGQTFIARTY